MYMTGLILKTTSPDGELVEALDRTLRQWGEAAPDLQFNAWGWREVGAGVTTFDWTNVRDPQIAIRFTRDDNIGARYIEVSSAEEGTTNLLAMALRKVFPVSTSAELRDEVLREGARDPAAYARLGIGVEGYDEESESLIREGLRAAEPEVRIRAAMAVGHLQWPEFRDAVFEALARETDPRNQRLLEMISQWYG